MFNIKKVKHLQDQLDATTLANQAIDRENRNLTHQRDSLVAENKEMRKQIYELRCEYNKILDAKEKERRELCDQIGELEQQLEKAESEKACLQERLSRKGCRRNNKGQFVKHHTIDA